MTEEDAKAKWCPFARVEIGSESHGAASANRLNRGDPLPSAACIGSACMAWQALPRRIERRSASPLLPHDYAPAEGFCGLAQAQP